MNCWYMYCVYMYKFMSPAIQANSCKPVFISLQKKYLKMSKMQKKKRKEKNANKKCDWKDTKTKRKKPQAKTQENMGNCSCLFTVFYFGVFNAYALGHSNIWGVREKKMR